MSADSSEQRFPRLEYARSSRSTCRVCKKKISMNSIRLGRPSEFRRDNGEVVRSYVWVHLDCAWEKYSKLVPLALEHNCGLNSEDKLIVMKEAKRRGLLGYDPSEVLSIRDLFSRRSVASFRGRVVETFFSRDTPSDDSEFSPFILYLTDTSSKNLDLYVKVVFKDLKRGLALFSKIKEGDIIEVKKCDMLYPYGNCPVAVFTSSSSLVIIT